MGFFEEVNLWLTALLDDYIHQYTAQMAAILGPAIVTLGTLYVLVWGYLQLAGQIQQPVLEGLKRIATLAVVFGISLHLWLYDAVIVDVFYRAPALLAGRLVGATDFPTIIDTILFQGNDVGQALLSKAGVFHGNLSFLFAAIVVYLLTVVTAVYAMFLLTLSRVALAVLLAIGPLIIPLFLFKSTRRLVEAWIAQLANYGFVAILAGLVCAFMMHVISKAAMQAQAQEGGIQIAHAIKFCAAAFFTILVMRQVLPMASGLASGFALSSYGIVSGFFERVGVRNRQRIAEFSRGAFMDRESTRWDSPSRKTGYWIGSRVRSMGQRDNSVRR
jgi:type IV secretion system protein VirB6